MLSNISGLGVKIIVFFVSLLDLYSHIPYLMTRERPLAVISIPQSGAYVCGDPCSEIRILP